MRELPVYLREASQTRTNPILRHTRLLLLSFAFRRWLQQPSSDFFETLAVSESAELRSSLLSMCIEAPESITNSLSSNFITDGAGRHQTSAGEKNSFVLFSELWDTFGQSPRVSAGTSLLSFSLFLRPTLQVLGLTDCADEDFLFVSLQAMDLSFLGCLRDTVWLFRIALVELLPRHL